MDGRIVAVILIASGPGSLAISDSETKKIISKCQAGLKFWADQALQAWIPLSFVLEYKKETISATDPTSCPSRAFCYSVVVNAFLTASGYSTGRVGEDQLAQSFKNTAYADGAFLAFFSKYKQYNYAYAYYGGGPISMQYSNGDWGTDLIDRVFAHEIGHVLTLRTKPA